MVPSEDRARQIIEAFPTCFTLLTLSGWLLVIEASFDNSFGITKRTLPAFWPTQFAHCIVTLAVIYQTFYVYLQLWAPFVGQKKSPSPLAHYDPGIQYEPCFFGLFFSF